MGPFPLLEQDLQGSRSLCIHDMILAVHLLAQTGEDTEVNYKQYPGITQHENGRK